MDDQWQKLLAETRAISAQHRAIADRLTNAAVTIPRELALRILDGLEDERGGSREEREFRKAIEEQAP